MMFFLDIVVFPTLFVYFKSVELIQKIFGRIEDQTIIAIIKSSMLILPAIPVVIIATTKRYFSLSRYSIPGSQKAILYMSLGHLGLIGIFCMCVIYAPLAGWLSIPFYLWSSSFYAIGLEKTTKEMKNNLTIRSSTTR